MRKLALVFFLLSIVSAGFAQKQGQALIDSLLTELPRAAEDTNKVLLLAGLCYNYYPINPDQGINYGKQALALADKLDWAYGIAQVNGNLGINYAVKADYDKSIEHFLVSLKTHQTLGNKSNTATTLVNIGNIYLLTSNYPNALDYYLNALKIQEEIDNKKGIALCLSNIGLIYKNQSEFNKALDYFLRALKINETVGTKNAIANNLSSIGIIYDSQQEYPKALEYFSNALKIQEELGVTDGIAKTLSYIGNTCFNQGDYANALQNLFKSLELSKSSKSALVRGDVQGVIGSIYLEMAREPKRKPELDRYFSGNKTAALQRSKIYLDSAIVIQQATDNLKGLASSYKSLSSVSALLGNYQAAYDAQSRYKIVSDSIFNLEKEKKITQTAMQYEFDKKETATKAAQEKKDALAQAELKKQKLVRNGFIGGFALVLVFMGIFYVQRNKIKAGKKRSDELLLNILPEAVAEELKAKGSADAQLIDQATVLFTDFEKFTQISQQMSPTELVNEINECYSAFDRIMEQYGIEKIKTIGDAYMAAGGLPLPKPTHATDTVRAALAIRDFMEEHNAKRIAAGLPSFDIRIGIHSGPLVAGIVGVKKFAYDIWGDTVNTAARMESSGVAGKVNISRDTFELVKAQFQCEHRGKVSAKDKGEVDMYFVEDNKKIT
ncbi:MAG: tetratricopeptide repeat protein [Lewinellaceae bacterium]|nr:tetratricopeptide repeat protein [Saprospiraceae bacterium]MCB9333875.1 tetratricopeptide repeat protein [Lewinellaceae bacterium]